MLHQNTPQHPQWIQKATAAITAAIANEQTPIPPGQLVSRLVMCMYMMDKQVDSFRIHVMNNNGRNVIYSNYVKDSYNWLEAQAEDTRELFNAQDILLFNI